MWSWRSARPDMWRSANRRVLKLEPSAEFAGAKSIFTCSRASSSAPRHHGETHSRRSASRLRHLRRHRGLILIGGSQERRNHGTRVCGSPLPLRFQGNRMKLAKSSAKWINFSRHAGSLISRKVRIKRTPSLGSAASGSRSLLTSSPRLLCLLLWLILHNPLV
jgi:hypothetical protein